MSHHDSEEMNHYDSERMSHHWEVKYSEVQMHIEDLSMHSC